MSRKSPRLRAESLERRDLLTISLEMGPSDPWMAQIAEFDDTTLSDLALDCGEQVCEQLTLVHRYDGIGNNADQPTWGATHQPLLRIGDVGYADGMNLPGGVDRPNPRVVSNMVATQNELGLSQNRLSNLIWIWGQFIDHDITLTPADPTEAFNVSIPMGDEIFDPMATGEMELPMSRSMAAAGTGGSVESPRIQVNEITSFVDGSAVYGSDDQRVAALREFVGGRLKVSAAEMLPYNETGLPNEGGTSASMFLAGDVRANENVALTAMHTVWVREHNLRATEVAAEYPDWNDEQVFQFTRAIVTAEIQAITYNEFLPALLGADALGQYEGYDAAVNPTISNLFAGATFRLGHSMLSENLMRMDANHQEMPDGPMPLRDAFFAPHQVTDESIDVVLQGAAHQLSRHIDTQTVDSVRNFLFGQPGAGGFDLASLNIQRGRDLGLADYNAMRVALDLPAVESFDEITSDASLAADLETLYGSVDNIDPWVGALAEDHLPGAAVGELIYNSLRDQFESLRDGDRLWYENRFSGLLREQLSETTLADVLERTTHVAGLQDNVFIATQALPERGDVTGDFVVNSDDLFGLAAAIERRETSAMYDINLDGIVDCRDSVTLATEILGLIPGDVDGSGEFNSADLISMFQTGEYEDDVVGNSTWIDGDFNGDGEFDSTDMIQAMQTGLYVSDGAGPMRAHANAIPATDADRVGNSRSALSPIKADRRGLEHQSRARLYAAAIDSVFELEDESAR